MIIVISGFIASGKSAICKLLKEQGYNIYNCDERVKELYRDDLIFQSEVSNIVGFPIIDNDDNQIRKKELSDVLFHDQSKLSDVENLISLRLLNELCDKKASSDLYILESATICKYENLYSLYNDIIWIEASESNRLERLIYKRGYHRREALLRLKIQNDLNDRVQKLKEIKNFHIVMNNGSIIDTLNKVIIIIKKLINNGK